MSIADQLKEANGGKQVSKEVAGQYSFAAKMIASFRQGTWAQWGASDFKTLHNLLQRDQSEKAAKFRLLLERLITTAQRRTLAWERTSNQGSDPTFGFCANKDLLPDTLISAWSNQVNQNKGQGKRAKEHAQAWRSTFDQWMANGTPDKKRFALMQHVQWLFGNRMGATSNDFTMQPTGEDWMLLEGYDLGTFWNDKECKLRVEYREETDSASFWVKHGDGTDASYMNVHGELIGGIGKWGRCLDAVTGSLSEGYYLGAIPTEHHGIFLGKRLSLVIPSLREPAEPVMKKLALTDMPQMQGIKLVHIQSIFDRRPTDGMLVHSHKILSALTQNGVDLTGLTKLLQTQPQPSSGNGGSPDPKPKQVAGPDQESSDTAVKAQ